MAVRNASRRLYCARMSLGTAGRARRLATCTALLALACAWPRLGHAEDRLEIPASCGSQAELEREVGALEQADERTRPRPSVRMRPQGARFVLVVELAEGARTLRDVDCRALFRAAILIVALRGEPPPLPATRNVQLPLTGEVETPTTTAQPSSAAQEPWSPAQPAPKPSAAPAGPSPPRVAAAPQPRARASDHALSIERRTRGALEARALLGAGASYGIVPKAAAAFSVGLELARERWAGQLALSYLTPGIAEDDDGRGVNVQGYAVSSRFELLVRAWLRAGLGVDLYLLQGRGRGALRERTAFATLPTARAGLSARLLERGRFRLMLPLDAMFAPTPARFVLTGAGAVYTTSSFGFQGGLSACLQFR